MDDLDALLADLQNSSRGNVKKVPPADDFPPPPSPSSLEKGIVMSQKPYPETSATLPSLYSPYTPPPAPKPLKIKSVPQSSPHNGRQEDEEDAERSPYKLSELEGLLQDLDKASDFHRKSNHARPHAHPPPSSSAPQQQQQQQVKSKTIPRNEGLPDSTANNADTKSGNQVQVSVGAVEALLDELDNQVSSTKVVVQVRPPATRAVPSNEQNGGVRPPSYRAVPSNEQNGGVGGGSGPRTASTATKELDDLMASLSDFKVNTNDPRASLEARSVVDGPPPPSSPSIPVEADYAKVEKHPPPTQKQKAATSQPAVNNLDSMLGSLQTTMSKQGVTTVTKGTCAGCNKPIIGQVCTALGKTWHPEHFACCVCETELGTKTFFERDGKPYCEEDYHDIFAPKCFACNGPILDSCVTSMDRTWHPEHFVCAECGRPFGEAGFHEKDGKAYCRDDYFRLFAPKCSGCNEAIIENYISALNGHWHPRCFACMECHQPFQNGSFFEHEGMPYCEMHYHARRGSLCYSCQKPITGRCITAMHRKFHPEHFICAFCLKQLNKGTFKEQNDKPYCHGCFVKLFG